MPKWHTYVSLRTYGKTKEHGGGPLPFNTALEISLNNFIRYSQCQVVQLFRLMSLLINAFTTIVSTYIVLGF